MRDRIKDMVEGDGFYALSTPSQKKEHIGWINRLGSYVPKTDKTWATYDPPEWRPVYVVGE